MARIKPTRDTTEIAELPIIRRERQPEPEPGEVIARFQAYFSKMSNTRYDELAVTFVIQRDDKYQALPLTDQAGFLYDFEVRRPRLKKRPSAQPEFDAFELEDTD